VDGLVGIAPDPRAYEERACGSALIHERKAPRHGKMRDCPG